MGCNRLSHEEMNRIILDWIDETRKGVIKMFDQQKITQEIFDLSKNYWLTTMDMMTSFQDQNEKMWHTLMDQGLVVQQEGRKMVSEWLTKAKQARETFMRATEDNLKRVETVFGSTPKSGK